MIRIFSFNPGAVPNVTVFVDGVTVYAESGCATPPTNTNRLFAVTGLKPILYAVVIPSPTLLNALITAPAELATSKKYGVRPAIPAARITSPCGGGSVNDIVEFDGVIA